MIPLKYNTASQEVPLGYFLDSTDGNTEETGLTINNTDIKLWKSGATTLANKNSGGATHISNGIYYCTLDATDTNTYGPMVIFVHVSGALTVRVECVVMEADAYDALYAASGTGHIEADMVQVSGDSGAADNLESDYDGTGYNKSNSTIGTCTTNTDMRGTDSAATQTSLNSKIPNNLNTTASGNIGIDWANVENPGTAVDLSQTDIQLCDTVTTNSDMRGTDNAFLAASAPANFSSLGISVGGAIDNVTLVATTTTNTDMRGTDSALLASSAPSNFGDLSITASTGLVDITQAAADKAWGTAARTLTAATNITSDGAAINTTAGVIDTVATNSDMRGTDNALLAASAPANFGDLAIIASTGLVSAGALTSAAVQNIFTETMSEAYASNGSEFTFAQGLYATHQMLMQFAISGTSYTVRQLDNSTTAFTATLNDGTNPTSLVRT